MSLTPGVEHAARVPEERGGGVVEVVAAARDGGGVEQDVLVGLADSRVSIGESWAAGLMLTTLPGRGTGSAWARRRTQTAPERRRRRGQFGSSFWIWVIGGDGGVGGCG